VTDTMAQSCLHNTSRTSGAAAETAADKKTAKYVPLVKTYIFVPIAV